MTRATLADFAPNGDDITLYTDTAGSTIAEDGDDVFRIDSANSLPIGRVKVGRKTKYTRMLAIVAKIEDEADLRNWLWSLGRTDDAANIPLRQFSADGNAPATHVGYSEAITPTEETNDAQTGFRNWRKARKTNAEWQEYGLSNAQVDALWANCLNPADPVTATADMMFRDRFTFEAADWGKLDIAEFDNTTVLGYRDASTNAGQLINKLQRYAERRIQKTEGRDLLANLALKLFGLTEIEPEVTP